MSGLHDTELDPIIITFISRRKKRRIINEREVVEALEEKWKPHVSVQWVNLEDFTFHEQLHLIRRSSVLIGMHGAGFGASSILAIVFSFSNKHC
jgi:capsular polysaccharide biosynthesis protein